MANQGAERGKNEQDVLDQIAGREGDAGEAAGEPTPEAAPAKRRSLGWMVYVGGALWLAVIVAAGAVGWTFFLGGA